MISDSVKMREHARRGLALMVGTLLLLALLIPIFTFRARLYSFDYSFGYSGSPAPAAGSIVEVQRGCLKKILLLDGELRAVRSRTIYAGASDDTKIVYLPPEGTVVKAGDRIVELDSSTVLTRIKENEEKIVAADNEIIRTSALHEAALRDMEVEQSKLLLAYEQAKLKARVPAEVVPRREYQDAQLTLEKTRTEYENQLSKIAQKKKEQSAELHVKMIEKDKLKVQMDRAAANLNGMKIAAPADGMVIYNDHWNERRKIQVGDVVWGGFPIARLPDLTEMEVLAPVNEVDGPRLSVGSRAEIKLDSYPDTVITGEVKEISQTAVKASWMAKARVFRVIVSLDRTVTEIMKPGMSAQVSVVVAETQPHLLVPRSAVKFEGETTRVFRLEGAELQREVAITIIAADALNYVVADNGALKEGDRILSRQN